MSVSRKFIIVAMIFCQFCVKTAKKVILDLFPEGPWNFTYFVNLPFQCFITWIFNKILRISKTSNNSILWYLGNGFSFCFPFFVGTFSINLVKVWIFKEAVSLRMELCWVDHFQSPLIKKLERHSLNVKKCLSNALITGESNFDDWIWSSQQSFIPKEIIS